MTPAAIAKQEEFWKLEREAVDLLAVIVNEFNTDPMSVQCFDLRIVERCKVVSNRLQILQKERGF
jgi:hypothetical protein